MKTIVLTLLVFSSVSAFSQRGIETVNGFKYAYVDVLQYENNRQDMWGLTAYLLEALSRKGIQIVGYDNTTWPVDAKHDPCLVGRWTPEHSSGNRAGFVIRNCENEIVYENHAVSVNWANDFYDNFQRAMKNAFEPVNKHRYSFNPKLTPERKLPPVESTSETEESFKRYFEKNNTESIEGIYKSYQSETMGYYKLGIKRRASEFIAVVLESDFKYWRTGEVKMYLEPTSMSNIFSVRYLMGNKSTVETFASFKNDGIISIELPEPTGKKSESQFIKLYPSSDNTAQQEPTAVKSSGSGIAINPDGLVATNAHVVDDAKKLEVSFSSETGTVIYTANVILRDDANDVALLRIDDPKFKGFTDIPFIIDESTEIGEPVFTIGYPVSTIMGDNYKVTNGIISANTGIKDDVRFLQISVPLQPGNSGGPLFDKNGNLVGLTTSRLNAEAIGVPVENANYAVKAAYLQNILKMLPGTKSRTNDSKLNGLELQEQVKILKHLVCLIKAY